MKRRTLLGVAAATYAMQTVARAAQLPQMPVRLGIIGAGSRGQELLRHFTRVPGVTVTAACDVYEPRFEQLQAIVKTPFFRHADHRAVLDRKDVDAVVVATPLYLHATHVVSVLDSGRDVYAEKSMGHTVTDCDRILEAACRTKRLFQIGHQYRYAPWYQEALRRLRAGELGQVTHIDAYWHRNNDWRRPLPGKKGDLKLERLINWRLYREYSGGLMAELGSHAIDLANWIFESTPETVIGTGGIDHWRDGRDVNDNVKAIFRYGKGQTFSFSSITTNAQQGFQQWVYGTRGSLQLTQDSATFYAERAVGSVVKPKASGDADAVTSASYLPSGENPGGNMVQQLWRTREGLKSDVTYLACRAFIECIRKKQMPDADARIGWASGVGAAIANEAIDKGAQVRFPSAAKAL